MSISRIKRLEKAQIQVLFRAPFFAPGVAKLPVEWDASTQTACTDGKRIRWNPDWFDKLDDSVLPTVLCHEVCHCMFGHLWRAPNNPDWETWNKATDHAVNNMLKQFGQLVTAQGLANPFPFPEPADSYLANPAFADKAEEEIYNLLKAAQQQGGGGGQGQGQQQGQQQAQQGGQGQSSGQGQQNGQQGASGASGGKPQPHSMPDFGQMDQPQPASGNGNGNAQQTAKAQQQLANDWEATKFQAAAMCKGRGNLPAEIERLVEQSKSVQVPWWEILRSLLREHCSDDWDFQNPAMEYTDGEFILPSMHSDKIGAVVFATDTSGSIDNDMLAHFQGEKQSCLDEMRPVKLIDIYCDTRIHAVREYVCGDEITRDCPGGGGTDFRPVFRHLEQSDLYPKVLVYLTDLDGSFPSQAPAYPVIWVTWSDGQAPFGETVHAS